MNEITALNWCIEETHLMQMAACFDDINSKLLNIFQIKDQHFNIQSLTMHISSSYQCFREVKEENEIFFYPDTCFIAAIYGILFALAKNDSVGSLVILNTMARNGLRVLYFTCTLIDFSSVSIRWKCIFFVACWKSAWSTKRTKAWRLSLIACASHSIASFSLAYFAHPWIQSLRVLYVFEYCAKEFSWKSCFFLFFYLCFLIWYVCMCVWQEERIRKEDEE